MSAPSASQARIALAFGAGGFFLVYFGQLDLGVVAPQIQVDLALDHDDAQWVVNAFMLGLAALVPIGGRLADMLGDRVTILAGLSMMAIGAAAAAIAPGFGTLVAALALQGIGAGIAVAPTVAIVVAAFSEEHRGQAVGRYVGLGVLALPITPVVAGVLVEAGDWRATFWVYFALTVAVLVVGAVGLPSEKRKRGARMDYPGAVLAVAGLGLLLGGAIEAGAWGWSSPATLAMIAAGVALLAVFVAVELRSRQPLVDIALVRIRALSGATAGLFLTQCAVNGVAIYLPIYLLTIVRLDPVMTGVAMLASLVFPPIMSPIVGDMVDRRGPRGLTIAGALIGAAGVAWLAVFVSEQEYWILVPGMVLFGVGLPLIFSAMLTAGADAAPDDARGAAAGFVNAGRWVGATVGTVAVGAVLNAVRASELDASVPPSSLTGEQAAQLEHLVLSDQDASSTATHDIGARVLDAVADAFSAGYAAGFWLCAAALVGTAAIAALTLRPDASATAGSHPAPASR